MKKNTVYIAGRSGASGALLQSMLEKREDVLLLLPPGDDEKASERGAVVPDSADVVILCLPPAAAKTVVDRIANPGPKIIDNSSAHRLAEGWVYGLPELGQDQRGAIGRAARVSNPGCFATGFILAVRPLVEAGVIDADAPICCQGVSGYSAGGKRMVRRFEQPASHHPPPFLELFHPNLDHAQVPEMQSYAGLRRPPAFLPTIGNFPRGMVVSAFVHRDWLPQGTSPDRVREALRKRYRDERLIRVETRSSSTNSIPLPAEVGPAVHLYAGGSKDHLLLVAVFDNLGKGGAIASVQNLNLLLGQDELTGVVDA